MDNNSVMSPADIAALTRGEGFGGGNNTLLIVIIFLFVILMGGGNLFGGRNANTSDYGQYATAASQQQILFGQQFGQINDRLTNLGNGICSLGYDMQGRFGDLSRELAIGQAGTNQQIMQGNYTIAQQIADCCCQNLRAMDALGAKIEEKFAAIEKMQLQQRIAQLEQANGQLFTQQQLCGVVRYPTTFAYSAGPSPFCGGGCCG